jgi:DNA-binding transcriptional LysR family regulator
VNPRAINFQLLLAFDALMSDLQVTRAAKAIGVSQPAMSHMLSRLRDQFGDPLLVRTARGMEPTSYALSLIEPVKMALRQVNQLFDAQPSFDASSSKMDFTVRMGDMNGYLMLPTILREMQKVAPGISLNVKHLSPSATILAIESGEVDFAVSTRLVHPKSVRSIDLVHDRMVCILRKGHPMAKKPITLDAFLKLRHINIVQAKADTRFVDDELVIHQRTRNVLLNISHWMAAPPIVEKTDLVAAISERMARQLNSRGQLSLRALPVGNPELIWRLYWHRRHDSLPAQVWMRSLVKRLYTELEKSDPLPVRPPR